MADQIQGNNEFYGGISIGSKIGSQATYRFLKGANIYEDPNEISIMPEAEKVSGTTVSGLVKWMIDASPHNPNRYFYDEDGKIYEETSGGSWSSIRTVADSNGQGLDVHDNYLYYTQDDKIGRYGPLDGSPAFADDWQTGLNDTSVTKFAPLKAFKEGLAVGHGNYIGWWDGAVWQADRLVLPPGFSVRTLEVEKEFLIIGAWRGDDIFNVEDGYVFVWDGTASTFNYFVKTNGPVNAIASNDNGIVSVMGQAGFIYEGFEPPKTVHRIPGLKIFENSCEVYPGAMSTWKNLVVIGAMGSTDSAEVRQGIYAYGAINSIFPSGLNMLSAISTDSSQDTDVQIGMVKGIGNDLYFSWRDDVTFGVDKISVGNDYQAEAEIETFLLDDERPWRFKNAKFFKVTHAPLVAGESISIKSRYDRETDWGTAGNGQEVVNDEIGSRWTKLPLDTRQNQEASFQVKLLQENNTTPRVTSIAYQYDDLKDDGKF